MEIKYEPGMVLCSKNGQRYTNAVVFEVDADNEWVTLISDFGNRLRMTSQRVAECYALSAGYLEEIEYGGSWPDLKERFYAQRTLIGYAILQLEKNNAKESSQDVSADHHGTA